MKKTNKRLENILREAKELVFLTEEEKQESLSRLMAYMKEHPVTKDQLMGHSSVSGTFASLLNFKNYQPQYALLSLAVLLVVGVSGVSFAANNALPGDLLYPVKVSVNEKVLGYMQLSEASKARYNVQLTDLRLQELERVAVADKLSDANREKIISLLNQHIKKAQKNANGTDDERNIIDSLQIDSDLEASLNAHKKILDQLATDEKPEVSARIKSFLPSVEKNISSIKKSRENGEDELSKLPLDVKSAAEGKLEAAQNKIDEVSKFLSLKKERMSQDSYATAQANLNVLSDTLDKGKTEFGAGNYGNAFFLSQQTMGLAQETKVSIGAAIKLNIELPKFNNKGNDNH